MIFLIKFLSFVQLSSSTKELTNNLILPKLSLNTSVVLIDDSLIKDDNIEMQPMNNNCISSPTWKIVHIPSNCFPNIISKYFTCCGKCIPKSIKERWTYFRSLSHCVVEHQYFEYLIIISILISSTTLVS